MDCYHRAVVTLILIAIVCGALAGLLRAIRVEDREEEVVSKIAASVAFVVLGALGWQAGNPVATWLVIGLALCAIGDALLLWDRTFDPGMWTFLLGHAAYIVAFHFALGITRWPPVIALPVALAGCGAFCWLWPHLGARKTSVGAYIVVISVMVWGAVSVVRGGALPWTAAIGALLFYLSDLTVARHRFVTAEFLNRAAGLPLYYAGQVLIALSVTSEALQ